MGDRRPIVGGNWKMNTDRATARGLADAVVRETAPVAGRVGVVIFPPFPYLLEVRSRLGDGSAVELGAQDVFSEPDGAFTGEVSVDMLKDCGCRWALIGHSERRHVIREPDDLINAKARAALDGGLSIILCIGETREQRDAGRTDDVNIAQLSAGLREIAADAMKRVVIAYEPVWAIGTGLTATPTDAQRAHAAIRAALADLYSSAVADATPIQYGGSVKPQNAGELFSQPDIDGGLIGGASLNAEDFAAIVTAAARATG